MSSEYSLTDMFEMSSSGREANRLPLFPSEEEEVGVVAMSPPDGGNRVEDVAKSLVVRRWNIEGHSVIATLLRDRRGAKKVGDVVWCIVLFCYCRLQGCRSVELDAAACLARIMREAENKTTSRRRVE